MGDIAVLIFCAVMASNVLVVALAALRYRRRPGQHPTVLTAEAIVCDAYRRLGSLYVPPNTGRQTTP